MTRPPSPLTMLLSRHTRRREFMALLGGAAAAWPLAARAQQPQRMRRVGVMIAQAETAGIAKGYASAFEQGLARRGWTIGRDLIIDYRWNIADGAGPRSNRGIVAAGERGVPRACHIRGRR